MVELPDEIWLAVMECLAVPQRRTYSSRTINGNSALFSDWQALWRMRHVNRRLYGLFHVHLQTFLQSFQCRIQLFSSLESLASIRTIQQSADQKFHHRLVVDELDDPLEQRPNLPLAAYFPADQHTGNDEDVHMITLELGSGRFTNDMLQFKPPTECSVDFDRVNTNDAMRFAAISFDGWFRVLESSSKTPHPTNSLHQRLYRIDIQDVPGVHYLAEEDMVMEYVIETRETEVEKFVPKPGGKLGEKICITARQTHYRLRITRLLCSLSWIHNGMMTDRKRFYRKPLFNIPMNAHSTISLSDNSDKLIECNIRSELLVHASLNNLWNRPELQQELLMICKICSGLQDRRQRLELALIDYYTKQGSLTESSIGYPRDNFWREDELAHWVLMKPKTKQLSYFDSLLQDSMLIGAEEKEVFSRLFKPSTNYWNIEWMGLKIRCSDDFCPDGGEASQLVEKWFSGIPQ